MHKDQWFSSLCSSRYENFLLYKIAFRESAAVAFMFFTRLLPSVVEAAGRAELELAEERVKSQRRGGKK